MLAQSIGGGGDDAAAAAPSTCRWARKGGTGGAGGAVQLASAGTITTSGDDADAIHAQ